jgi:hypothetical protein
MEYKKIVIIGLGMMGCLLPSTGYCVDPNDPEVMLRVGKSFLKDGYTVESIQDDKQKNETLRTNARTPEEYEHYDEAVKSDDRVIKDIEMAQPEKTLSTKAETNEPVSTRSEGIGLVSLFSLFFVTCGFAYGCFRFLRSLPRLAGARIKMNEKEPHVNAPGLSCCGTDLTLNAKFCTSCGKPVSKVA